MRSTSRIVGGVVAALLAPGVSHAAVHLVGAQLYSCAGDGSNVGDNPYGPEFQYSTNSSTSHLPFYVNGDGSAISVELAPGANTVALYTGSIDPGPYACLNLFFDDVAVSFNPPYEAGLGIPGDLAVGTLVSSSSFFGIDAGIDVQSYNSTGNSVNATSYSGAASFQIGGASVYVTNFAVSGRDGSVGLYVPEPAPALAAVAAVAALWCTRRHGSRSR